MSTTPSAPSAAPSAAPVATSSPSTSDTAASVDSSVESSAPETDSVEAPASKESTAEAVKQEKAVQEAIKKWKLKSGKQEREITSEAELVRLAQLGLGAHEKFEQAANTRKKAEEVLEIIQKNPAEALSKLGFDVRKLAEDFLAEEIQKEMLSPEQKKVKEMETQLKKFQEEKAEFERQQREQQISTLQAQYEQNIQSKIIEAIDVHKLPKNPKTVARFAEYMLQGVENGIDYDPRDLAPRIRRDLETEHREMYRDSAVEEILKILGDDTLKKIRQYELQKVKGKQAPQPVKTEQVAKSEPKQEEPKSKKTMAEFRADLEKLMK